MSDIEEIKELQEVLKGDSSNFQARRRLAILLLDNGFSEDSLKQFLFLIGIFPEDPSLYYNLGIVYEKIKKLDLAVQAYQKAISLSPETDFYYNLGLVYIDKQEYEKAIKAFEMVIKTDVNDANSYFCLGVCYNKLGQKELAVTLFEKTIELNDNDVFAHFYLGNLYKEMGFVDMAVDEYNKVLKLSPDYSWAYFNLGSINFERGEYDLAIENLQKTLELNPHDIDAYKVFSKLLVKLDRMQDAQTLIENAIKENSNVDLIYVLAQIYKKQKNFNGYIKAMKTALKNYKELTYSPKLIKEEFDKFMKEKSNE